MSGGKVGREPRGVDILFPICSCFPPRAAGRVTPWSSLAPGTQGYALPGPSADRRLKTKLPAGCSAAWRYHRGKWSMVNTLASSSGVRNFLQRERFGTSSQIWEHVYPFLFFSHKVILAGPRREIHLCFGRVAGRK